MLKNEVSWFNSTPTNFDVVLISGIVCYAATIDSFLGYIGASIVYAALLYGLRWVWNYFARNK